MSEKRQFRAIKGTRDILPPESALWNRVEETARRVFETYGYGEIRLPDFELARLFERSVGNETDIVTKELYSWIDSPRANQALRRVRAKAIAAAYRAIHEDPAVKEELLTQIEDGAFDTLAEANRICLRPEATASVVRAYIEHGLHTRPGDVKLYYIGPMFRRERPQKGRYRQFYQIGAEVLGQSDASAIDAELLEMLLVFFERVGLTGCTLHLNSIGCMNTDCRPRYVRDLRAKLEEVRDGLGPDSRRRVETNPLRVLDSKLADEQYIIEKELPRISDYLCADCRAHFAALEEQLRLRGIAYEINWRLVRGLDYYMRTTFEITAPGLGAQNAVCGGGRYDGLVELLGGQPTKGIGFAIGTDRVVLSLQEAGKGDAAGGIDVFIAWLGASAFPTAVKFARGLRDAGVKVELPAEEMKLKKSLGLADKLGARYAVIIGENEIAAGRYTLRRLSDGEQWQLSEGELVAQLKSAREK